MRGPLVPVGVITLVCMLHRLIVRVRPVLTHGEGARLDANKLHADGVGDLFGGRQRRQRSQQQGG